MLAPTTHHPQHVHHPIRSELPNSSARIGWPNPWCRWSVCLSIQLYIRMHGDHRHFRIPTTHSYLSNVVLHNYTKFSFYTLFAPECNLLVKGHHCRMPDNRCSTIITATFSMMTSAFFKKAEHGGTQTKRSERADQNRPNTESQNELAQKKRRRNIFNKFCVLFDVDVFMAHKLTIYCFRLLKWNLRKICSVYLFFFSSLQAFTKSSRR